MGFQCYVSRDSVILSCFSGTSISIIPADKFIIVLGTGRKRNRITDFYSDISTFHLPSVRIKSDRTDNRFFLLIMRFQSNVSGNRIFFPCLSNTGISVIPADKFIIILGAVRKCNGVTNLCGNLSTFHLPTVCIKCNCRFCLFPCGIIRGIAVRRIVFYRQLFILIPAFETVAFSGCVRECDIRSGDNLCAVSHSFLIIIDIGKGNRIFFFPLCVEVKVVRQADLLPRCVVCAASVRLCVPAHKVITEMYDISHKREKFFPTHDGHYILTGIKVRVGTHIAGSFRVVVDIISNKICPRSFCKIKVFSPFFCTVIRAVPWELLRVCIFVVLHSVDQHPARLDHIGKSPKHKGGITLKIFIQKDGCACVIKEQDIAGVNSQCKVIFHNNLSCKNDTCLVHVADGAACIAFFL